VKPVDFKSVRSLGKQWKTVEKVGSAENGKLWENPSNGSKKTHNLWDGRKQENW
jgi:hypothetical protein